MQDNASYHEAHEVLKFLAENHVPLIEWPPQLPDLNPLENLWMDFKSYLYKQFTKLFTHASKSLEARYHYGEVLQEV